MLKMIIWICNILCAFSLGGLIVFFDLKKQKPDWLDIAIMSTIGISLISSFLLMITGV